MPVRADNQESESSADQEATREAGDDPAVIKTTPTRAQDLEAYALAVLKSLQDPKRGKTEEIEITDDPTNE